MSGHSKWSQIKRQKGAADLKRAALYTKLANLIAIATREGGGKDPEMNVRLRLAIEKAKSVNMPSNTIDRAIQRGAGELGGAVIESAIYEGFGPGGVAVIVEVATDNKNRTSADVRQIFTRSGGRFGSAGSVQWMFDQRGCIISPHQLSDEQELTLIDAGAIDVTPAGDGEAVEILTNPQDLDRARTALEKLAVPVEEAELVFIPKTLQKISDDQYDALDHMIEQLEEIDGVSAVTTNAQKK